ncbi:hypothetical protein FQR65_LT09598 [Abscondita terminalis]|nr:hypothetical protein FQR65_LT09598 [Abscondita terminalis]
MYKIDHSIAVESLQSPSTDHIYASVQSIQLNKEELECVKQTQVNIEFIKKDKAPNAKPQHPVDPSFNDYLGCYVQKLRKLSKLQDTMTPYIYIPGYRTKYEIKNIKCNKHGEHVSGLPIPCVEASKLF